MHVPLPGSIMLLGLPDPSGALPEGCCCVIAAAGDSLHAVAAEAQRAWAAQQPAPGGREAQGSLRQAPGVPVLAYRNPGMLPSDIRRLALVPPPGALLSRLGPRFAHGVFFSTRGDRCVAQLMAGGDYDGCARRGGRGHTQPAAAQPAALADAPLSPLPSHQGQGTRAERARTLTHQPPPARPHGKGAWLPGCSAPFLL
jgi:hypothetical protein